MNDKYKDCNICNSQNILIYDYQAEELVCSNCGAVSKLEEVEYTSGMLDSKTLARHYTDISSSNSILDKTFINKSTVDANKNPLSQKQKNNVYNIMNANKYIMSNKNQQRSMMYSKLTLESIRKDLLLTNAMVDRIIFYCKKVYDKELVKGRSRKDMLGGVIILVAKEFERQLTFQEVAKILQTKKSFIYRAYTLLVKELNLVESELLKPEITSNYYNNMQHFINKTISQLFMEDDNPNNKLVKRLKIGDDNSIEARIKLQSKMNASAAQILNDFIAMPRCETYYNGKNPNIIALAIVYISLLMNDYTYQISQSYLEKLTLISGVSLRKRYKEVVTMLTEHYPTKYKPYNIFNNEIVL